MKKFLFLLLTLFLVTVIATILSATKPGDKVPDVSSAILLVGTVFVVFALLNKLFKLLKDRRKDKEIKREAAAIFEDTEATVKKQIGFLNKIHLKRLNTKFLLIVVGLMSLILSLYYYQWRPSEIRKSCAEEAMSGKSRNTLSANGAKRVNDNFRLCLIKRGLKPESLFVGN